MHSWILNGRALAAERGAIRNSRFKEEKMVMIVREVDLPPVAEVAKPDGILVQKISRWRHRFVEQGLVLAATKVFNKDNGRQVTNTAANQIAVAISGELRSRLCEC